MARRSWLLRRTGISPFVIACVLLYAAWRLVPPSDPISSTVRDAVQLQPPSATHVNLLSISSGPLQSQPPQPPPPPQQQQQRTEASPYVASRTLEVTAYGSPIPPPDMSLKPTTSGSRSLIPSVVPSATPSTSYSLAPAASVLHAVSGAATASPSAAPAPLKAVPITLPICAGGDDDGISMRSFARTREGLLVRWNAAALAESSKGALVMLCDAERGVARVAAGTPRWSQGSDGSGAPCDDDVPVYRGVPPGHPLRGQQTDWVARQYRHARRASIAAAMSPAAPVVTADGEGAAAQVEATGAGSSHAWPLRDLLPLPAVVVGGAGNAHLHAKLGAARLADWLVSPRGTSLPILTRPVVSELFRTGLGNESYNASSAVAETARLLLGHASFLTVNAVVANRSGVALPTLRQPWISPLLSFVVSKRTLETLVPAEVGLVARGLRRACRAIARADVARHWEGAVGLASALRDKGCRAGNDEVPTSDHAANANTARDVLEAALGPVNASAPGQSAARVESSQALLHARRWPSTSQLATMGDLPSVASSASPATPEAPALGDVGEAVSDDSATNSQVAMALLSRVDVDVAGSDLRAVEHISARSAGRVHARTADELAAAVAASSPPTDPASAEAVRTMLTRLARITPVSSYDDVPLPWLGMDERFAMRIEQSDPDSDASQVIDSMGSGIDVVSVTASVSSATVWGALRSFNTLVQSVDSWGLLGGDNRSSATDLLHFVIREDVSEISSPPSPALAALATSLSPGCVADVVAAASVGQMRRLLRDVDASLPIPVSFPLVVADEPWRPWRGLSVDTSRHFLPTPVLRRHIDAMAMSGLSVFHWHISDAQSWPLEMETYPELAGAGAWLTRNVTVPLHGDDTATSAQQPQQRLTYTRRDALDVVRYAADRGVRVVPEIDMPAHTRAMGVSAELSPILAHCDAVAGGGGTDVHAWDKYALNPTSARTYAAIGAVLAELTVLFPDRHAHFGADEVFADCWAAVPELGTWAATHLPGLTAALAGGASAQPAARGSFVGGHSSPAYIALLTHFLHTTHALLRAVNRTGASWVDSHELLVAAGPRVAQGGRHLQQLLDPLHVPRTFVDVAVMPAESVKLARAAANAFAARATQRRPVMSRSRRRLTEANGASVPGRDSSPAGGTDRQRSALDVGFNASDTASLLRYGYPLDGTGDGGLVQGWKCWEQHADPGLLDAAEAAADTLPRGRTSSRLLLNAACWYTDYSSPWAEFARRWPLPDTARSLRRMAALAAAAAVEEAGNDNIGSFALPAWALALFSVVPYAGGEAAVWSERMDGANSVARVWPRTAVIGDVLTSQSGILMRVRGAINAAVERVGAAGGDAGSPLRVSEVAMGSPDAEAWTSAWGPRLVDTEAQLPMLRFSAVRLLAATRRLWSEGIAASPLAVWPDGMLPPIGGAGGVTKLPQMLRPPVEDRLDSIAFNGMAPGTEQAVQRGSDIIPGLPPRGSELGGAAPLTPSHRLRALLWNVANGGGDARRRRLSRSDGSDIRRRLRGAGARYAGLLQYLRARRTV